MKEIPTNVFKSFDDDLPEMGDFEYTSMTKRLVMFLIWPFIIVALTFLLFGALVVAWPFVLSNKFINRRRKWYVAR